MKNKEIEELLNNFQEILENPTTTDECYDGRIIEIDRSYDLEQDEIKLLLSYIEQLEKENKILRENAEHNDKVVDKVNWEINILKHNRDKAIEYLEEKYERPISYYCCIKEALKILKGDSDENRNV